jgi:SAM-dependent methyltransferase
VTDYILDSRDARDRERARQDILQAAVGAWTARVLTARGAGPGIRCLDAGAGCGHVSRWLADRGATVVATDIDTHFLAGAEYEVHEHDVLDGPFETDAFDLVVARALVVHLRDRDRALANLAASVRPGGHLVVIDPSLPSTPRVLHASDPALHDRVFSAWADFLVRAGVEWDAAQALPAIERLGFDARGEGLVQVLRGGDPPSRLWSRTLAASAEPMIGAGAVTHADVAALVAMMDAPAYRATQLLGYATWAERL